MFEAIFDFIGRHKKKFIALGVTTAVGIGAYYYIKSAINSSINKLKDEMVAVQKRMEERNLREAEVSRLKDECSAATLAFTLPLRKQITRLTDPSAVTKQLEEFRNNPDKATAKNDPKMKEEQRLLWNELKVISITRLMASAYSLALLDLMLRVQQHVLARIAFVEVQDIRRKQQEELMINPTNNTANSSQQQQLLPVVMPKVVTADFRETFMLRATEYFLVSNSPKLCAFIHETVEKATEKYVIGGNVTRDEVINMIQTTRYRIEERSNSNDIPNLSASPSLNKEAHDWFFSLVILPDEALKSLLTTSDSGSGVNPPSNNNNNNNNNNSLTTEQSEMLKQMMAETMDILETPHATAAFEDSLSSIFKNITDDLKQREIEGMKVEEKDGVKREVYVLAKVLIAMKSLAKDVLVADNEGVAGGNTYIRDLERIPSLDMLARMIFEIDRSNDQDGGLDTELGLGADDIQKLYSLLGGGNANAGGNVDINGLMQLLGPGPGQQPQSVSGTGQVARQ